MRLNRATFEKWARDRFKETRLYSARTQLFLPRCPFCGDAGRGEKRWRHVVNFRKELYWCYRNECLGHPFELVRREMQFGTEREAIAYLASYGELFDLTSDRLLGEALLAASSGECLTSSPVVVALRDRINRAGAPHQPPTMPTQALPLPEGFSTDWSTSLGNKALQYALSRRVPRWFLDSGRLGYSARGRMASRLIFLSHSLDGRLTWYTGRALLPGQEPKYLDPGSEEGLRKGLSVFALDFWRGHPLVVCEGTLSALSVEGGVAIWGHSLAPGQAREIAATHPPRVTVAFDPDVSLTCAFDAGELLRAEGCSSVGVAILGEGDPNEDPDGCARSVSEALDLDPFEEFRGRLARGPLGG